MKSANASAIRSTALSRVNQLVRAHRHIDQLRPAFAQWTAGEIYVCKKTGDYRYRFGDLGKSVTPWSGIARKLFTSPAAFAFAATVLGDETPAAICVPDPVRLHGASLPAAPVNVLALADQQAA